jgi:hypothetical protein
VTLRVQAETRDIKMESNGPSVVCRFSGVKEAFGGLLGLGGAMIFPWGGLGRFPGGFSVGD